ncbi:hypothetical protein SAY86_016297 [Trapa natans]|uniref:NAD-dependent epimerase/dehydratase domain-containing protein n=1 Tax=Trapa natans TaxID=22666 RepID=A0AAN7QZR6_TRANT|nr:hypothetical protein SAY86_016297 [Trapa natans]
MEMEKRKICVTGAGGFVASWLVKLLLSKGYVVHGTVRDPDDDKNAHLTKLDGASDNLKLFKANLLDYDSLRSAIMGCEGVLHVACPVPTSAPADPEVELLEPAIKGTLNVLRACSDAHAKRVVYVSSTSAVLLNPGWPKDRVKDESCWSDKEHCRAMERWYVLAKTEAESAAFEYGKQKGLDVVSVNPGYVLGPVMNPSLVFSTLVLLNFLQGKYFDVPPVLESCAPNKFWSMVDVRDVADAILMAYEKPEAEGRYICTAHNVTTKEWVEKMKRLYPEFTYLDKFAECDFDSRTSSEKLQKLGWTYRPMEETMVDSIQSFREVGLL